MKKLAPCQLRNIAKGIENLSKASDFAFKVFDRPTGTYKATMFTKPIIASDSKQIFVENNNKHFIEIKK